MKLFDKLKNALFEEDEDDTEEVVKEVKKPLFKEKAKVTVPDNSDEIVKRVDVEKTFEDTKPEIKTIELPEEKKAPIIFEDEDFLSDTREINFAKTPTKEDKVLYGGYERQEVIEPVKQKEKFKPSPVISPVFGVLETNYSSSDDSSRRTLDELFTEDRSKPVTFDEIRQKAYGGEPVSKEEPVVEEDKTLLYEMQEKDDTPGIEKITLGDAEEYYNDLGLEYEVDYKDAAKSKATTRTSKNKSLSDELDLENTTDSFDDIEDTKPVIKKESVKITKPKTAKEIKKEKAFAYDDDESDEAEEKNLYDLIDMMYDSKK